MELKEQLEALKNDLSTGFETKSKLDIQTAIEAFETKANASSLEVKTAFEKEIEAIKADFQTKSKLQQDHLDALDIRLKQANGQAPKEVKTFNQIIAEHTKVQAVRLFGETASDGLIRNKFNFTLLGNILDGLSVHRIIHQLVEIPQNLVIFAQHPFVAVVSDVRLKVCTCRTAEAALNLDGLQTAVEVKSQVRDLHNVFPLRYEPADELAAVQGGCAEVLGTELVLLFAWHYGLDGHCLRRERIISVAVVQLRRVVQVHFEIELLFMLIKPPIAEGLVLECRKCLSAFIIAYLCILTVRQHL